MHTLDFLPEKPIVGMLHLPALPGSPRHQHPVDDIERRALREADALVEGGVHALILENFGDVPFFPLRVPAVSVAVMTRVACRVRQVHHDTPLGINVLRNDGQSALAIALASNARFIRVNVLCGARVTDQGVINGTAHGLMRDRRHFGAEHVQVWADVNVKHSTPLADRLLQDDVADTVHRGLADVVIASGSGTGQATSLDEVRCFRQAASQTPVFVGSGVSVDNVRDTLAIADGVIVGSALKHGSCASQPVDPQRVREFMQAVRDA